MARAGRAFAIIIAVVAASACLPLVAACTPRRPAADPGVTVVVEVVDGDTIVVRQGDTTETVRLLGVDTPETKHPTKPIECFGPEAAAFTASVLPPGTPVQLERDVEERDTFGRLLAHVRRSDGVLVNYELVARGFAATLTIAPNSSRSSDLRAAEAIARANGLGLWGSCGGPGRPIG